MALHDGKSSGTAALGTRKYAEMDAEKDWNFKIDDFEVSTREGDSPSGNDARRPDPVTDLRQRLTLWGTSYYILDLQ